MEQEQEEKKIEKKTKNKNECSKNKNKNKSNNKNHKFKNNVKHNENICGNKNTTRATSSGLSFAVVESRKLLETCYTIKARLSFRVKICSNINLGFIGHLSLSRLQLYAKNLLLTRTCHDSLT